jgi:hypothetical protein
LAATQSHHHTTPLTAKSLRRRFGYSRGCPAATKCDLVAAAEDAAGKRGSQRKSVACSMANQCHGYRNASSLDDRHLGTAHAILQRFR